jgi:hypothetical protein
MDSGIDEDDIVDMVKWMYQNDIGDSRQIKESNLWDDFIKEYNRTELRELLEDADDCISILDLMDWLKGRLQGHIDLIGGSENECLKEIQIALKALGIAYNSLGHLIYEENLNETENAHNDELNAINYLAEQLSMPKATEYIDSGSEATVFETTDPNIVARYGSRDRIFELENWANSGAVVDIIKLQQVSGDDFPYRGVISWNEKVDTNVTGYFYRKYEKHPAIADKILSVLNRLYHNLSRKDVEFLKQFDETEQFANAIEEGMPTNDLAVDSNLGINKNGQVVAYDL